MTEPLPSSVLIDAVTSFLRKTSGESTDALSFTLLSGGNSHVTWRARTGKPDGDYVVKVAQPDGPLAPYDVAHEAEMMRRAHSAGVPAPALVGTVQDGDLQFIVMRHVPGESPSLWDFRKWLQERADSERLHIGRSLLSVLPTLRGAAPAEKQTLPQIYADYIGTLLGRLESDANGIMELPQSFRRVHDWLTERLSLTADGCPVLCHGDFRIGNAVFRDGSVTAMLDWERSMPGHALHDLGFFCLPGMKSGKHICGVLSIEEIAEIWEDLNQETLDRRLLSYFRIVAIYGEYCNMVRAFVRLSDGRGRLASLRALPLVARLHDDLISGIRAWNHDDFAL